MVGLRTRSPERCGRGCGVYGLERIAIYWRSEACPRADSGEGDPEHTSCPHSYIPFAHSLTFRSKYLSIICSFSHSTSFP